MKFFKKNWYALLLTVVTLIMGVVALVTSGKLTTKTPVAPTVPQVTPKASEPACTLTFNLTTESPTETPTGSPTITPSESPTITPSETPTITPSESPTVTPSETPTITPSITPSATPINTPSNTPTNTPTPTPLAGCNYSCTVNDNCTSGLVCSGSACRNPNCTDQTSCSCPGATVTPTPTTYYVAGNTPTPIPTQIAAAPTPKTPVSGSGLSLIGTTVIGSALLLIFLGLAL